MKERWQKQWEKERTGGEKNNHHISDFGTLAKLFILGKHCHEKCEHWWDNRESYITLYEEEARKLIESLNGFNLKLDLIDWLRNKSGSKSYQAIFNYLRQTHLCDAPSIPAGGANSPIRCLSTAKKKEQQASPALLGAGSWTTTTKAVLVEIITYFILVDMVFVFPLVLP